MKRHLQWGVVLAAVAGAITQRSVSADPADTQGPPTLSIPLPALTQGESAGAAVAVSGSTIVIGAPSAGQLKAGSVFVLVKGTASWTLQQTLHADDAMTGDGFGASVAIFGDTVVVGAPGDDHGSLTDAGSAYVYTRTAGIWSKQAKLVPVNAAAGDDIGRSVSISGNTAVLGAPLTDVSFITTSGLNRRTDQGAAFVYVRSGAAWSLQSTLSPSEFAAGDAFGTSLSLDGDALAVGVPRRDIASEADRGAVSVWRRSGTSWSREATLTASRGAAGDALGEAVALSADVVAAGSPGADTSPGQNQGATYVFRRTVGWAEDTRLVLGGGADDDAFGAAVAVAGGRVIAGTRITSRPGSVGAFRKVGDLWNQETIFRGFADDDAFGTSVAIDSDVILIGSPRRTAEGETNAGGAYFTPVEELRWRTEAEFAGVGIGEGTVSGDGLQLLYGYTSINCCWVTAPSRVPVPWATSSFTTPWGTGTAAPGTPSFTTAGLDISTDGRIVAFASSLPNLLGAGGDTNDAADVFVVDRADGVYTRVSRSTGGAQAGGSSGAPALSADGRFVAFTSNAINLVSNDTNNASDIFVHDRTSGQTERISRSSTGTQGNAGSNSPAISGDGRYVVFASAASNLVVGDTNGVDDIFLHDRSTGQTTRVSGATAQANGASAAPAISRDGRWVVFHSEAANLVAGDANGKIDVFRYDRTTAVVSLVSVSSGGRQGNEDATYPDVNADGRVIVFQSASSNLGFGDDNALSDVFARDTSAGTTARLVPPRVPLTAPQGTAAHISDDGHVVTYRISAAGSFSSYLAIRSPRPEVSSVTPAPVGAAGGDLLTIRGTGFVRESIASPGLAFPPSEFVSSSELRVTAPPRMAGRGAVDLNVGDVVALAALTYTDRPPALTTVTPTSGPTTGGTEVVLTGAQFVAGATTVTFGGVTGTNVAVAANDATRLTVTTPAGPAGAVDVTVSTAGGSATLAQGFSYQQVHPLTVARSGTGSGSVSSAPAGITCGADCVEQFGVNAKITLTAAPAADSRFTGWSGGGCTGTGVCIVTLAAPTTVTATFQKIRTLTVTTSGPGSVTSEPAGISCGSTCSGPFVHGSTVKLTATPQGGASLQEWGAPSCPPGPTCTVQITGDLTVFATFTAPAPTVTGAAPAVGTTRGGTRVTVTGAGYRAGATLTVGGVAATEVTLINAETLTALTPKLSVGSKDLAVTNSDDGKRGVLTEGFSVVEVADRTADLDRSGGVDVYDATILAACLGTRATPGTTCWDTDLDYDGAIGLSDLAILKSVYGNAGLESSAFTLFTDASDTAVAMSADPSGRTTLFAGRKDSAGNPLLVTTAWLQDAAGQATRIDYDAAGRPTSTAGPTGARMQFEWQPTGQASISFTTADGRDTHRDTFTYAGAGGDVRLRPMPDPGSVPDALSGEVRVTCGGAPISGVSIDGTVITEAPSLDPRNRVIFSADPAVPGRFTYRLLLAPVTGIDRVSFCSNLVDLLADKCEFVSDLEEKVKVGGVGGATAAINAVCTGVGRLVGGRAGPAAAAAATAECKAVGQMTLRVCSWTGKLNIDDPAAFCKAASEVVERHTIGATVEASVRHPLLGSQHFLRLDPRTSPVTTVELGSRPGLLSGAQTVPAQPEKGQPYLVMARLACPTAGTQIRVTVTRDDVPIISRSVTLTQALIDATTVYPLEIGIEVPGSEVFGTHRLVVEIPSRNEASETTIVISRDVYRGSVRATGSASAVIDGEGGSTGVDLNLQAEVDLSSGSPAVTLNGTQIYSGETVIGPAPFALTIPLTVNGTSVRGAFTESGSVAGITAGIRMEFAGTLGDGVLTGNFTITYLHALNGVITAPFTLLRVQK